MKLFYKLFMAVIALFTMIGCGQKKEVAKKGEVEEITVMVWDRGIEYSRGNSVDNNELTRWINEQMEPLGVRVKYMPVHRIDTDTKVGLMLAAGDAPDVLLSYTRENVLNWGDKGGLLDLKPHLKLLDKDVLDILGNSLELGLLGDKQVALPKKTMVPQRFGNQMLREDLVKGMGMEMPKNKEELIKVLYAMKEHYPDVVPFALVGTPLSDWHSNWVMSYTSRKNERENWGWDTKSTGIFRTGGKEGFRALNQFWLDGIVDKDFMLDIQEAEYKKLMTAGRIGFTLINNEFIGYNAGLTDRSDYKLTAVDLLDNPDGEFLMPSDSLANNYIFIPKKSEKKIEAIMKYVNWMGKMENALNVEYGIYGRGADLNAEGFPIRKGDAELKELGLPTRVGSGDIQLLYSRMSFGVENDAKILQYSNPKAPDDVVEKYIEIKYNGGQYALKNIGEPLESDKYVGGLRPLITQFSYRVISAPAGKFDEVYEKEYQTLLDSKLGDVFNDRAGYYDTHVKK